MKGSRCKDSGDGERGVNHLMSTFVLTQQYIKTKMLALQRAYINRAYSRIYDISYSKSENIFLSKNCDGHQKNFYELMYHEVS